MVETSIRIAHARARGIANRETITQVFHHLELISSPATEDLIVLRALKVRCGLADLEPALQRAVDEATAHAVRVTCGAPVSESSAAVRFVNVVERAAALTLDLAFGTARDRWYWQKQEGSLLEQRSGAAIASLWGRYVEHLPELCQRLRAAGRIGDVWAVLNDGDVTRIADEVWSVQVRAPSTGATQAAGNHGVSFEFAPALTEAVLRLVGPNERFEVCRLAATMVLAWQTPLLLSENSLPDCRRLADSLALTVLNRRSTRTLASTPLASAITEADPQTSDPEMHRFGARAQVDSALPPASMRSEDPRVSEVPSRPPLSPAKIRLEQGSRLSTSRVTVTQAVPAADPLHDDSEAVTTRSAGVVFLVNAIRHPRIWGLLHDLGMLGGRYHGWSIWRTIAEDIGLAGDDPAALWLRAACESFPDAVAPPSPSERAAIQAAARDLYGAELWSARLLTVSGTLRSNLTHVDAYLPLTAVRIEVRMAGLDLNPGWVNWLGRVVTIHYRGGSETV